MELKTTEDVKAFTALSNIERIQKIEKQIQRAAYVPTICFAGMVLLLFIVNYGLDGTIDASTVLLVTSGNIAVVAQALIKRSDLKSQLFELRNEQ